MPGWLSNLLFPNVPEDLRQRKIRALVVFLVVVLIVCGGLVAMLLTYYDRVRAPH